MPNGTAWLRSFESESYMRVQHAHYVYRLTRASGELASLSAEHRHERLQYQSW